MKKGCYGTGMKQETRTEQEPRPARSLAGDITACQTLELG